MKRVIKPGAIGVLVLVAAVGTACGGGPDSSPQRDVSQFLHWANQQPVTGSGIDDETGWLRSHKSEVLAEGDRACSWIRSQPRAPLTDTRDRYSVEAMGHRYTAATDAHPIAKVTELSRWNIAIQAWESLCPADRAGRVVSPPADD